MMSLVQILVFSAGLTWVILLVAALVRTRCWTVAGLTAAFGNRDNLPPDLPIAGRASRAAWNMVESMVIFIALVLAVRMMAKTNHPQVLAGANLFFWARVIFWPVYLAGIPYLRTIVWTVGIVGLLMMAAAIG
jgi:uncharacterized MAPEG superfamily protein